MLVTRLIIKIIFILHKLLLGWGAKISLQKHFHALLNLLFLNHRHSLVFKDFSNIVFKSLNNAISKIKLVKIYCKTLQ